MKLIDGSKSVNEIIAYLEEQFPGVDLKNDVLDFLEHAYGKNWICTND
jgi:hypothetical protein